MKRKFFQIAIDGPVGAGKSTVARLVAEKLKILYIDTGAMYRAVALAAREQGIDWGDRKAMAGLVRQVRLELKRPVGKKKDGRRVAVYLNGKDVSWEIREGQYGEGGSVIGQYPEVRKVLVNLQRQMSQGNRVIMEGRDIGTRVLPKAEIKIYMDADLKERVERKREQLREMGKRTTAKKVKKEIVTRDRREMTRKVDPLRPAKGAWKLDTTNLSVDEVVDKICAKAKKLLN